MRGIEIPDRTEDFTADPSELFFDLAFVFAFSQLVGRLIRDPTWAGVGEAALLFAFLWLGWSQFTWSANAVSGNSRNARLVILVATTASVPMAAAVGTAFGDGGPVFMISLSVILAMGLWTLSLAFDRGSAELASLVRYAWPTLSSAAVLVVGSFSDDEVRVVLWLIGLTVFLGGTIAAGSGDWVIRSGHFSERHGLILIVALGEVIVAIGLPVVDTLQEGDGFPGVTVLSLVAAGAFAGLLWWGYFDRPGPAFEHRGSSTEGSDRPRFHRDVFTYSHAPVVAGVIVAAAALEEITLHPEDVLRDEFRLMLVAGLGLYLAGVVIGVMRAFSVLAWERIVCALAIAGLVALSGAWDGVVLLIVVDLVLLATLIAEHIRVEQPFRREPAV